MNIDELIENLQTAKEIYGGKTKVLIECNQDVNIKNLIFASYTDPENKNNNITELRLTDGDEEDIECLLYDCENLEVEKCFNEKRKEQTGITKNRLERITNELVYWASEVINDEEELYNTAKNSWGLTDEECELLEIKNERGE